MELLTPRFGPVTFDPQEVLVFEQGLLGWTELRQWLLLADAQHPVLLWLQSVRRPLVAQPVACLQPRLSSLKVRVSHRRSLELSETSPRPWILLAPLRHAADQLSLDLTHPLLIDADRHRGLQLCDAGGQTLQCARPEQLVPLRQSA